MPKARQSLISLETTPYYHCVSRCVRRAFLCGNDPHTGRSFEHRRAWVEGRLLELSQSFALDICAYAVMSNHTHVVLYVDKATAESWTTDEVIERWHSLFAGTYLSHQYLRGEPMTDAELSKLNDVVAVWRERLRSVSWFMRCLNEHIARLANAEDGCTGRFWEGRFKSQAILDEAALAACLAYVELNPIRVGMAETPECSEHTSIKRRIETFKRATASAVKGSEPVQPPELLSFAGNPRKDMPKGLPFVFVEYLELIDWTGRIIRDDKRGSISSDTPPVLQRLHIEPAAWLTLCTDFESTFFSLVGREQSMRQACDTLGQRWAKGQANSRVLFLS